MIQNMMNTIPNEKQQDYADSPVGGYEQQPSFDFQLHKEDDQKYLRLNTSEGDRQDTESKEEKPETDRKQQVEISNMISLDISCLLGKKYNHKSLLVPAMQSKYKNISRKNQIAIFFFESKKSLVFQKSQLQSYSQSKAIQTFIPYFIKQYCKLYLSFQPDQVNSQSFALKLADQEGKQDPMIDPYPPTTDINILYEADSLVILRNSRKSLEGQERMQQIEKTKDYEIVKIIIGKQRQFYERIQEKKTVAELKQRIVEDMQIKQPIVLIEYTSFEIVYPNSSKLKVCQLKQKVIEVFILEIEKKDDDIRGNEQKYPSFLNLQKSKEKKKQVNANDQEVFFVNEGVFYGKQSIIVKGTEFKEVFQGGLISSLPFNFFYHRPRYVYNLMGILIDESNATVKLKFKYKDGDQFCVLNFSDKQKKEKFMNKIIKLGRKYKREFSKIQL